MRKTSFARVRRATAGVRRSTAWVRRSTAVRGGGIGAVTAGALLLAACGGAGSDGFENMDEWLGEIEEAGIECDRLNRMDEGQSEYGITHFADCFQDDGTASLRLFDSEESNAGRIEALRDATEFHEATPAVLKGNAWAVDCTSVELCEQWSEHFDGDVLTAPEF